MRAGPEDIPVTVPEVLPTFATEILLLLQSPPPEQDKDKNCPTQTADAPVIGGGIEFTVTP